jgi:hypothetical protein
MRKAVPTGGSHYELESRHGGGQENRPPAGPALRDARYT